MPETRASGAGSKRPLQSLPISSQKKVCTVCSSKRCCSNTRVSFAPCAAPVPRCALSSAICLVPPCKDLAVAPQTKSTSSNQNLYTKEDFVIKDCCDWGLSEKALQCIKDFMVGEAVPPARFTEAQLKEAGYTSWKQYEIHAALRAW